MNIQWFNERLPNTLKIAVGLLYAIAVLSFLGALAGQGNTAVSLFFTALFTLLAGVAVANEQRGGFILAVIIAVITLFEFAMVVLTGVRLVEVGGPFFTPRLLLSGALLAVLFQPPSRQFERTWFS